MIHSTEIALLFMSLKRLRLERYQIGQILLDLEQLTSYTSLTRKAVFKARGTRFSGREAAPLATISRWVFVPRAKFWRRQKTSRKSKILLENANNKSPSAVRSGRKSYRVDMMVLLSFEQKTDDARCRCWKQQEIMFFKKNPVDICGSTCGRPAIKYHSTRILFKDGEWLDVPVDWQRVINHRILKWMSVRGHNAALHDIWKADTIFSNPKLNE